MLRNIIKRAAHQQLQKANIEFSAVYTRHSSDNAASGKSQQTDDLKSALDIEAELFENSRLQHSPISTSEVLRKHKTAVKAKPKRAPPPTLHAPSQPLNKIRTANEQPPIIQDSELNLEFVRLRQDDNVVATLMTTIRSRKRRDKNDQIIIEGRRLITEALAAGLRMQVLLFSQREQLSLLAKECRNAQQKFHTKIYKVPQHNLKIWSTLTTPPGLLAVFERPSIKGIELAQQQGAPPLPVTVVCDNIREPNNLGSIIRNCAALPCQQIITMHGCCDPWESKALRGGCGGHFRLPIKDNVPWDDLPLHIPPEVADDCYVFAAENNFEKLQAKNFPRIDYAQVDSVGAHNVLLIGGESHGVSNDAYKFMELVGQQRSKCLYIPLAAGIDSLNVTSALTLILFELRRKLNMKTIK